MRRFSAGIRVVTALLSTVLILTFERRIGVWAICVLLTYGLWSGQLLWREAAEMTRDAPSWVYWVDVIWAVLMMKLLNNSTMMLTVTLVHPVVLVSIGYGVRHGLALASVAAAGLLLDSGSELMRSFHEGWEQGLPALMVLALVPAAALISRPMSMLRRRLELIGAFEEQLDPRRGLRPVCGELVERLRESTGADVVALILPLRIGTPAMLATRHEGVFRARRDVHTRVEALLAKLPDAPVSYVGRRWWDVRPTVRLPAGQQLIAAELRDGLATLSAELDVRSLHVVPLTRYSRQHGHFIVGYKASNGARWDASALATTAPELLRIIEQATLVDQLQDESASHERARIGRDLHDSAIQPYLGLKYAVECVALRIPKENPARGEIDALADLVNGEVSALRELISGLRTGGKHGDDALIPAVRRQVRRFSLLFGIDVQIECPETLPTTRALASALFHIVNESLNNVRKHTGARNVWITLSTEASAIRVVIRDDAGTMLDRPEADFEPRSLSERVADLGGSLQITRPDGLNTELVIVVPV